MPLDRIDRGDEDEIDVDVFLDIRGLLSLFCYLLDYRNQGGGK
jgi:hypothetical protein